MRRTVVTLAAMLLAAGVSPAQETKPISASLGRDYQRIQKLMVAMAEKMPQEHYSFKPAPEVRTFGELVAHVANHQAAACSMATGAQQPPKPTEAKTKTELVAALKQSNTVCDAAHDSFTDDNASEVLFGSGDRQVSRFDMLMGDTAHSWEEYGYMSLYLRLKGIVPPSSDPEFRKTLR